MSNQANLVQPGSPLGDRSTVSFTALVRRAGIPFPALASPGLARLYRLNPGEPPPADRPDLLDLAWALASALSGLLPSRPWPPPDGPGRLFQFTSFLDGQTADATSVRVVFTPSGRTKHALPTLLLSLPDEPVPPEPLRVCVVEGDPEIARWLARLLERSGFEVIACRTAADALAAVALAPPDLVLLEADLPGGDGFDLCRRLRAAPATAAVPVVFCTARPGLHGLARAAGALACLEKPLDLFGLPERLRRLLAATPAANRAFHQKRKDPHEEED